MTDFSALTRAVSRGKTNEALVIVKQAIQEQEDISVLLDNGLIAGMRDVGKRFSRSEVYVPELLVAARAAKACLDLVEPILAGSGSISHGRVAVGTVRGDLHDIGKNLVAAMLRGAGYEVIDLGVNCGLEKYQRALDEGAEVIVCSALLTTTMPFMREVVNNFKHKAKIIVGGAPVTQAFADAIGADGYSADAYGAVKLVDQLLMKNIRCA